MASENARSTAAILARLCVETRRASWLAKRLLVARETRAVDAGDGAASGGSSSTHRSRPSSGPIPRPAREHDRGLPASW
jgi:hypothetical protein